MKIEKIETSKNLKELINTLEYLHTQESYIFRGQPNAHAIYTLTPSAFRTSTLQTAHKTFGVNPQTVKIWYETPQLKNHITKTGPDKIVIGSAYSEPVLRLFDLNIKIMQYYFRLYQYFEKNPDKIFPEDHDRIKRHSLESWIKEETFVDLNIRSYEGILVLSDPINGRIMREPYTFEEFSAFDETCAQHYDIHTAALDWSFNPYVALFFGLFEYDQEKKHYSLKNSAQYFSIYVYKQITNINSPVFIKNRDGKICNLRAEAQEGTFTYFSKPCLFYLENRHFPSIEYFDVEFRRKSIQPTFELMKYSVQHNTDTNNFLMDFLKEKDVTESRLFPDKTNFSQ